ncbi:MAG TPA: carotenoid biosynthesis protein [Cryomorphaceae bacterium]|nr:carotenoid biosynthesis protein [Cryomorphaceae bacterium]
MNKSSTLEQFKSKKAGIAILIVLHIVGALGFLSPLSDWFVYLTPMNLIITAGMLWIDSKTNGKNAFLIIFVIWLFGYAVEIIGVKTGFPFGDYSYSEVLGWNFFEVPPLIGINWLIIIWSAHSIARTFMVPKNLRWLITALLAVGMDFVIEPVAIEYEFWYWASEAPPLQNYISWFVVASFMAVIFEKYPLVQKPRLGATAFVCQLLFFGLLYTQIN